MRSLKNRYWKIECHRHLLLLYETKINAGHISEKQLIEFIRVIVSKYALSDDEILEGYMRVPFKAKKDYINIIRANSNHNEPLSICFSTQVADISVTVCLTD